MPDEDAPERVLIFIVGNIGGRACWLPSCLNCGSTVFEPTIDYSVP